MLDAFSTNSIPSWMMQATPVERDDLAGPPGADLTFCSSTRFSGCGGRVVTEHDLEGRDQVASFHHNFSLGQQAAASAQRHQPHPIFAFVAEDGVERKQFKAMLATPGRRAQHRHCRPWVTGAGSAHSQRLNGGLSRDCSIAAVKFPHQNTRPYRRAA
jgi:hypothetical protein